MSDVLDQSGYQPPEAPTVVRENGPYVPVSYDAVGNLQPERVRSVRETGFLPGNTMAKRPKNVKYMSEVMKMMLRWPEYLVADVLKDPTQPIGARAAAAQVILALKGQDTAVDRVMDRTEGKIGPDVEITNNNMSVNAGKMQITQEQLKNAFDAIEAKRVRKLP